MITFRYRRKMFFWKWKILFLWNIWYLFGHEIHLLESHPSHKAEWSFLNKASLESPIRRDQNYSNTSGIWKCTDHDSRGNFILYSTGPKFFIFSIHCKKPWLINGPTRVNITFHSFFITFYAKIYFRNIKKLYNFI